jgi:hypothetical protein
MDDEPPRRTIKQGWRDGSIPFPALVLLIVATIVGGLGGASIGGAGGLVLTLVVLVSVVVLLVRWSDAPR